MTAWHKLSIFLLASAAFAQEAMAPASTPFIPQAQVTTGAAIVVVEHAQPLPAVNATAADTVVAEPVVAAPIVVVEDPKTIRLTNNPRHELPPQKFDISGVSTRNWIKFLSYTASVACAGVAAYKHYESLKKLDSIDDLKDNPPPSRNSPESDRWVKQYDKKKDEVREKEMHRNIYGVTAIYLAVTGFFFF